MTISIFKFGSRQRTAIRLPVDRNADALWQLQINDSFPDFTAQSTKGRIDFTDWASGNWVLLISHPAAFTPVCTTEIRALAERHAEFEERRIKIIALTGDPLARLKDWSAEIERDSGVAIPFPHISDEDKVISKGCGLISHEPIARGKFCARRSLLIDPHGIVRMIMDYPLAVGRSVDEIFRCIDALMLAERLGASTPSDWRPGDPLLLPHEMSPREMKLRYGTNGADETRYFRKMTARINANVHAHPARSDRFPEINNSELERLVNEHNHQMAADEKPDSDKPTEVFAVLPL